MNKFYSKPTGSVWIRDFDRGMVETMGGTVNGVQYDVNGIVIPGSGVDLNNCSIKNNYYMNIAGANPSLVPVIFNNPEQTLESKVLQFLHIARESIDPARQRWHSDGAKEYVYGVPGTEAVVNGVSGFGQIEYKNQAWPFDIQYRISVYARYEHEALAMLRFVMRQFQVMGRVLIKDSLNEVRSYTTYMEGSINDLSEIVDIADRTKAYALTFRVEAELDLQDPVVLGTVSGFQISIEKES